VRAALLKADFRFFVEQVRPRYLWYPHCEQIANVLQRVADGELRRVMLFVPPRHSKSETVSRLFTAYYLNRYPERWIGINSYASDLAYTFSRAAQENYLAAGGPVSGSSTAVSHWETGKGGGMWAAGVGGPITGKGFHCLPFNIKVATPSGEQRIGDLVRRGLPTPVYSFNHATGQIEVRQAYRFMERMTTEDEIQLRIGWRTLKMTPEHPVYVEGRGYILAGDVRKGDIVLCRPPAVIAVIAAAWSIVASQVARLRAKVATAPMLAIWRTRSRTRPASPASSVELSSASSRRT
jgi:hypothetical protein